MFYQIQWYVLDYRNTLGENYIFLTEAFLSSLPRDIMIYFKHKLVNLVQYVNLRLKKRDSSWLTSSDEKLIDEFISSIRVLTKEKHAFFLFSEKHYYLSL